MPCILKYLKGNKLTKRKSFCGRNDRQKKFGFRKSNRGCAYCKSGSHQIRKCWKLKRRNFKRNLGNWRDPQEMVGLENRPNAFVSVESGACGSQVDDPILTTVQGENDDDEVVVLDHVSHLEIAERTLVSWISVSSCELSINIFHCDILID
jgi:hypothetical protein